MIEYEALNYIQDQIKVFKTIKDMNELIKFQSKSYQLETILEKLKMFKSKVMQSNEVPAYIKRIQKQ